jgi:hypothetical protein
VTRPPKKPKPNAAFHLTEMNFRRMNAEFDMRIAEQASDAGGELDLSIQQGVFDAINQKKLDQAAADEYREAARSDDPKKLEAWRDKYASQLTPDEQKQLDVRIDLLKLQEDVKSGELTQEGKDERIKEIMDTVDGWKPSPIKDALQGNLADMDKFNELGKLSDLAEESENPLQIMTTGIENAGFPPTLIVEITGVPIMTAPPVANSSAPPANILLSNPAKNAQQVSYNLGPHPYTMAPGETQSLNTSYVISFDPGDGSESRQYSLGSGAYQFSLQNNRWELARITPRVTIDNTRYNGTFNYLVNGQEASLNPGEVVEHTDPTAVVIEFDRGAGAQPARKVLTSGKYVVGIDPAGQSLDLYDAANAPQPPEVPDEPSPPRTNAKRSKAQLIEEALARLKARGKE